MLASWTQYTEETHGCNTIDRTRRKLWKVVQINEHSVSRTNGVGDYFITLVAVVPLSLFKLAGGIITTGPRSRLEVEVEPCSTCEAKLKDVMLLRTGRNWKRCVVMNVTDKKTQRWCAVKKMSNINQ